MTSNGEFSGKVFLVTGASSGLGETLAIQLASRGASVTLCGQNEERLESVRQRCVTANGGHGERFAVVQGDLQQGEVRKRCVQTTIEKFGKLDVLVPNAGTVLANCDIYSATEESYDALMGINVKSVFFLIQEAVPHLQTSKGCIVSTSSILSTVPSPPSILYPMSKAAIDHMTRCLALDLAPKGIRVNAINPAFMYTRVFRDPAGDEATRAGSIAFGAMESKLHPLGERCLKTEEAAEAIMFLASEKASFITGQCLTVDGGRSFTGPLFIK